MSRFRKTIFPAAVAIILAIGAPYMKDPGTCGISFPIFFTGGVWGFGGEEEVSRETGAELSEDKSLESKDSVHVENDAKNFIPEVTLVEIGAENCLPCKMMKPVMAEIEKKYKTRVNVVFHDVLTREGKSFAEKYKVRVIPTQILKDRMGNEFFRHEGFLPFDEVKKILSEKGIDL